MFKLAPPPTVPQKQELIKVRVSTPFMVRTKCKYCGGAPSFYWYTRNPTVWFNPRKEIEYYDLFKNLFRRFSFDFYLAEEPKYFTKMGTFKYAVNSYRPRLHRARGTNPVFDKVEYLSCDCGRATWAFAQKAGDQRLEKRHRRARYCFPNEFID
jgi:hypothetical protein